MNVLEVDLVAHFLLLVVSCKNHRSPQVNLKELTLLPNEVVRFVEGVQHRFQH